MAAAESGDRADAARRAIERGRSKAGDALGRDPELARRVLEELLPQDLAAVSVLVAAVRAGVPDRLAEELPGHPAEPVLARLSDALRDRESVAPERAGWAVAVWAVGLGLAEAAPAAATATTTARPPTPPTTVPTAPPPPRDTRESAPRSRRRPRFLVPLVIVGGVVVALVAVGGGVIMLRPAIPPVAMATPIRTAAGVVTKPTPSPTPTPLPPIVLAAHRGGDEIYPLETAAAMLDAAKRPGVAVETDMHYTSDGVPVLVHDDTVDPSMRCVGPTPRPRIADKTYAWLNANCRTLASASPSGGRYPIPKVEDVARQLSAISGAQWLVEFKTHLTPQQETQLFDVLEKYGMVDRTVLTSRFQDELAKAGAEAARRKRSIRLLLFVNDTALSAQTAAKEGLWCVGIKEPALTKDYVTALHAQRVKALVWTPDSPDGWQRAEAAGVDIVLTDKIIAWATWHSGR